MLRYNQKTNTLIVAALVILLCIVSISGATYALFTSSGEDGKIGVNVTSGDIEVDIIGSSADGSGSLVGEVLKFEAADGRTEVLFEPGSVYHSQGFRIENPGNIPIKFILYITKDKDDKIGDAFVKAFDVWVAKDPKSDDGTDASYKDVVNPDGTDAGMWELFRFTGELGPGETSDEYHLVFRMKETAGNELQDMTFSGVGITVFALQGNATVE